MTKLDQAPADKQAADKLVRSYVSAVTENKRDDAAEVTKRMVDYVLNKLPTEPPQRKPLTDEQIEDLYFDNFSIRELKEFARAIEAAHGIKG